MKNAIFSTLRHLLALIIVAAITLGVSSCGIIDQLIGTAPDTGEHTEHVDADGDNICDECEQDITPAGCEHAVVDGACTLCGECFTHKDADCSGKCDSCGRGVAVEHTDADNNGRCDKCALCLAHTDANCDGRCDACSVGVSVSHADENGDGKCDKCSICITHTDSGCDGRCDECGAGVAINHTDSDGDDRCDKCNLCLTHKDADCNGKCDACGAGVAINHTDADENGKCDSCSTCLSHGDKDCSGACDTCDEAMKVEHIDSNGDNKCDKCKTSLVSEHTDADCNGRCDVCGENVTVAHVDSDNNGVCDKCKKCIEAHKDENENGECDRCGAFVELRKFKAEKSSSVSAGATLYPTTLITYSGNVYRGSYITYTITVKNTGNVPIDVIVSDTVPANTVYVSGCDAISGRLMTWSVSIPVGEERSMSYKVSVSADNAFTDGGYIEGEGASVNGTPVDCPDLFVEKTLNEVDRKYIERAVRILMSSTYSSLEFAKHAYTIAFTSAKTISEGLPATPAEIINKILAGDADIVDLVAPGMYGGRSVSAAISGIKGAPGTEVTVADLISGDLLFVSNNGAISVYIVCSGVLIDITGKAAVADTAAILAGLGASECYALIRPSVAMNLFTPSDPDEVPEEMNEYQEALVKTAEAYLMRGEALQYEDVYFGLNSSTGEYRWTVGEKAPEEYTSDEWGYVNCAVFTYDVYLAALGYTLPDKMYTTLNLTNNAGKNGMSVFRFERTRADVYTEAEQLAIEAQIMATLEVGDIIVRRHTNVSTGATTGHAMLYVGNGRIIHSGGSSYSKTSGGVGYEIYEPTIRCHKVRDYLFGASASSMFNDEDNIITIVRPLNAFNGEIPANTTARVENMEGITAEKLSSHPSSVSVNCGDLITFTFVVRGIGEGEREVEIYDKVPRGCSYVSGGERVFGDELYWTVKVGCGESVSVSYTVMVGEVADGTLIDGTDATVGGVKHRCAAIRVKKTLTKDQQSAIIDAIEEIRTEGSGKTALELANEIYKNALGIDAIFTDTNSDSVMRDGEESVFKQSTKKYNSKYMSELQDHSTYYSSMLVDHLYGGMRFYSGTNLHDRTRLLREHNLVVGDILIARSSSAVTVYIWAGDDIGLLSLSSGEMSAVDFKTISEKILYYGRDFAVLRPSYAI